jgi:SAM-dependent methyltransferase
LEIALKNYEPVMSFGEEVAKRDSGGLRGDEDAAVAFLEGLAGDGPALELAIGTGRIALPLASRGIRVDGIDFSAAMVAQLRKRPGGDRIEVTMGDFAEVAVLGQYRLIYVVFNTLFNLLTQDDQVRCFQNVASHLADHGSFVVEGYTPASLHRRPDHGSVGAKAVEVDHVLLEVDRHDPVTQTLEESHVLLSPRGVRVYPIVQRYAWPSELELMARLAGLRLTERWSSWDRRPVTANSRNIVSVYGR